MGTYWDNFIVEYKEYLHTKSISQILEAFWYYCNDNLPNPHPKSKADEIMGKQ